MNREITVIAHNIRSAHNVGSLLRTCDGLGVNKLYLSGYTPYPREDTDERLPHIARKVNSRISKTALGAEKSLSWQYTEKIEKLIGKLKSDGYTVIALEQSERSVQLNEFSPPDKIALLLGEEVRGIENNLIEKCDEIIEIPMLGKKESFNVSVAAAIALYHLRFTGI